MTSTQQKEKRMGKKCEWCDDDGFQWVFTSGGKVFLCIDHVAEQQAIYLIETL